MIKKIGYYYDAGKKEDNLMYSEDNDTFFLNNDRWKVISQELIKHWLTNPFDKINAIEDEEGYAYESIVCDNIWIAIEGKTLEELFNNLALCFKEGSK